MVDQIPFKEVNDENDVADGLEISKLSITSTNAYNSSGRPSARKRTDQTILQQSLSETSSANVFSTKIPEYSEKIENSENKQTELTIAEVSISPTISTPKTEPQNGL